MDLLNKNIRYDSIKYLLTINPIGVPDSIIITSFYYVAGKTEKAYFLQLKNSIILIPGDDFPIIGRRKRFIMRKIKKDYSKNEINEIRGFSYLLNGWPASGGPNF